MKTSEFIAKAIDSTYASKKYDKNRIYLCCVFDQSDKKWEEKYPELLEIIKQTSRDSGNRRADVIVLYHTTDEEKNNFRLTLAEFLILYFQDQGD